MSANHIPTAKDVEKYMSGKKIPDSMKHPGLSDRLLWEIMGEYLEASKEAGANGNKVLQQEKSSKARAITGLIYEVRISRHQAQHIKKLEEQLREEGLRTVQAIQEGYATDKRLKRCIECYREQKALNDKLMEDKI